jgi:YegS/Rv2252/BmrU family lipid kinase
MSRKILFIVNPRSGKRNSEKFISIIKATLGNKLNYEFGLWTNINEFNLLAERLKKENFTDAIAVGGDGSVNLVAQTILGTDITLGIVPAGSGNGLARSIGMPMNTSEAVELIAKGNIKIMDTAEVNGHSFFCTSGVGFDAHIGGLFANLKNRGLKAYLKLIVRELMGYKPQLYTVKSDGVEIQKKCFFITVANAGQFGNNFYISPGAKLNDGLFNVVMVRPFRIIPGLAMVWKITRGRADKSKYIETFACKNLTIIREKEGSVHFDGEPGMLGKELYYVLRPNSLKVIAGPGFNGL